MINHCKLRRASHLLKWIIPGLSATPSILPSHSQRHEPIFKIKARVDLQIICGIQPFKDCSATFCNNSFKC